MPTITAISSSLPPNLPHADTPETDRAQAPEAPDAFAPGPTPWINGLRASSARAASFEASKAALLDSVQRDDKEAAFLALEASALDADGGLRPESKLVCVAESVTPVTGPSGASQFRVTTRRHELRADGTIDKQVTTEDRNGGAWLKTPAYQRADMDRMRFDEFAAILREHGRRFDRIDRLVLTTTDSQEDTLRWVAEYTRKRLFWSREEIANVDSVTKEVFFRKA